MTTEHVLTPDDKCPCGKPQEGSGYCSYECYSKHDLGVPIEPTTDPAASMGEPLSEAERGISVEAIRSRVDHQLKLDRSADTLAARNLAEAVDDRTYLLRRHDLMTDAYEHAKEQKAKYEQRVIGWREQCSLATRERDAALVNARQLQERLDAATARVGVLEGQLATARALHTNGIWTVHSENLMWDEEGCVHCRQEWPCATAVALGLDGGGSDA